MTTNFYPKIRDIVNLDLIPGDFEFLRESIEDALDNVYYRNLIFQRSKERDKLFFKADLKIESEFQLKIPGTDLVVRLNPPLEVENTPLVTPGRLEL